MKRLGLRLKHRTLIIATFRIVFTRAEPTRVAGHAGESEYTLLLRLLLKHRLGHPENYLFIFGKQEFT